MSSAEGQVQNLGYRATFPLLLNISGEPTYFMALKDDAGLVKMYGMVNIQKYQWVATGNTIQECEKAYSKLLKNNGITSSLEKKSKTISGRITNFIPVNIEGNTHIYFALEGEEEVFDVDLTNTDLLDIVKYQQGDMIKILYTDDDYPAKVVKIK